MGYRFLFMPQFVVPVADNMHSQGYLLLSLEQANNTREGIS